jgi:hypothetical protein
LLRGVSLLVPQEFKKTPLQVAVHRRFIVSFFCSLAMRLFRRRRTMLWLRRRSSRVWKLVDLLLAHGTEINGVPFVDVLLPWEPTLILLFLNSGADVVMSCKGEGKAIELDSPEKAL